MTGTWRSHWDDERLVREALRATFAQPIDDPALVRGERAVRRSAEQAAAGRARAWWPRRAVTGMAAVLVLGTPGVAAAASAGALPGEWLYPVKGAVERIWVGATPGDLASARIELRLAARRLQEIARLRAAGPTADLQALAWAAFDSHIAAARLLGGDGVAAEVRGLLDAGAALGAGAFPTGEGVSDEGPAGGPFGAWPDARAQDPPPAEATPGTLQRPPASQAPSLRTSPTPSHAIPGGLTRTDGPAPGDGDGGDTSDPEGGSADSTREPEDGAQRPDSRGPLQRQDPEPVAEAPPARGVDDGEEAEEQRSEPDEPEGADESEPDADADGDRPEPVDAEVFRPGLSEREQRLLRGEEGREVRAGDGLRVGACGGQQAGGSDLLPAAPAFHVAHAMRWPSRWARTSSGHLASPMEGSATGTTVTTVSLSTE